MKADKRISTIKYMLCLVLAFTAILAALLFMSAEITYAADNEPTNLHWSETRPEMAEWTWPDNVSDDEMITVEAMYSKDGSTDDPDMNYAIVNTKEGFTNKDTGTGRYVFSDSDTDNPFNDPQEGYYWFSVIIDENTTALSDPVKYITLSYTSEKVDEDGNPVSDVTDWNLHYSFDGEKYYYVRSKVVARPGSKVRLLLDGLYAGFSFGGYSFSDPQPVDCSDASEPEISFTLNESTSVKFTIVKISTRVKVDVDYRAGHEGSAAKTAEAINNEGKYNASVDGHMLTISDWPKSTRKVLKDYIADKTNTACAEGNISVYENDERYTGSSFAAESDLGSKIGLKSIDKYEDVEEYVEERNEDSTTEIPDDGETFYLLWDKPVSKGAFTVEAPVCGTEIGTDENNKQTNAPVVTAADESVLGVSKSTTPYWQDDDQNRYTGTIQGGESYTAVIILDEGFGYYISSDEEGNPPVMTVNGVDIPSTNGYAYVFAPIEAVHVPGNETVTPATCTEEGSIKSVCTVCNTEFVEAVPALGHNWGAWKTTKKATAKAAGVKTRVCANNSAHTETKAIAKNNMTAKAKSKKLKVKAKKKTTIKPSKAYVVKNAKGKLTYRKVSGNKKITVTKNGKITVKKGLKKGKIYKVKVKVTSAATTDYAALSKTITLKFKVK